ncbi:uncharacterized protein LOC132308415 [Cornus florida]|uniref:uncharacterized protein LOC132308415 n=1 Tax=Cornus florida TaxID=4283 RepID=UPI00289F612A|nr:uncharacterized protein LOC132308415 [Cornus florida]
MRRETDRQTVLVRESVERESEERRLGAEKMGQIVKRKKKGRPSKADLARRAAVTAAQERDLRRSVRRRNVRYNFDIDDYIDDEYDEEDDEDEMRREKKLKLVLKLQNQEGDSESAPSQTRRVAHAPDASASSSDSGNGDKPLKKRKIDGDDEIEGDVDEDDDENEIDDDDVEVRERKAESKGTDSVPGTPLDPPLAIPLPDKKSLELILDKLQKKDIYGVYAEPVDPEELPDYHDVIDNPMDFATVRKKLGNGSYSTFEQFETDVFLICTNAMQYNAPDTIYHKQARSIQELASKKFERLRVEFERSDKELKTEQKTRSNILPKKQAKKPLNRTVQEPVGSDFSSGATLATVGDFQNGSNATQAAGCERPCNADGLVEANASLIDNNLDKAEDILSGKNLLSKFGRKAFVHDENRRATYNISTQPAVGSESIFTTFDGEIKQLVAVGLHADHSYARSLARFAATLGPVAWKVASQRIEQALPLGFKFGRGWVGEYEPLPTPVLMLENCSKKKPAFLPKLQCTSGARKEDKTSETPVFVKQHPVTINGPTLEEQSSLFGPARTKPTVTLSSATDQPVRATLEGTPYFFKPTAIDSTRDQQQNLQSRNSDQEKNAFKQVELNCPPSANQNTVDFVAEQQISNCSPMPASRSMESVSRSRNLLQSVPFKQPDMNGVVAGGLSNGRVTSNNSDTNRMVGSSSDSVPNQMVRAAAYFPRGQEQGLSDPVQLMRLLAENAQKQQKSSNHSMVETPPVMPSVPSPRRDDSGNAAAAAARAWMSLGAGGFRPAVENTSTHKNQISADSLYNRTRELQPQVSRFRGEAPVSGMHFQPEKNNFPLQAFATPPVRMGNEAQFQNRPMVFPPLVTADLSRFQVQSPWRGLNPQTQISQKQESLPPDLNIGFQPSGSPVRQSSGVLVDSQQPDLALQL